MREYSRAGSEKNKKSNGSNYTLSLIPIGSWKDSDKKCHVLFIGETEEPLSDILSGLKGKPVLTVSDLPDFVKKGGMIGFVLFEEKTKFSVNQASLRMSGLSISADVLEIAHKVVN